MPIISGTVQVLTQRIAYAVLACLCLLITASPSFADEIISEPATLTANQISGAINASAAVRLLDRTTATLVFDQDPINLAPGGSNTTNLVLTNTGINDLSDGSISLVPPPGVTLNISNTPDYTAVLQMDGSWLITLTNNLNTGQMISIPVTFSTASTTPLGSLNLDAAFSGRDSSLATAVSQILSTNVLINIQPDATAVGLFLSNSVSQQFVVHDEFITYTLRVSNQSATQVANSVTVQDLLPPGLRFMSGTLKLNGTPQADPAPSADGRSLFFNAGSLAVAGSAGDTSVIEYMAYISSATPTGTLPSPSRAFSSASNVQSNNASASITVRKDPINSDTHLFGRVTTGECANDNAANKARVNTRLQSELIGNSIAYRVIINSEVSQLESYTLNLELPESLSFEKGSAMLDGTAIEAAQHTQNHKSFTIRPSGTQWQHTISFKAKANTLQHGVFNTRIYGEYITADKNKHTQQAINNSYQAAVQHGNFRRFSYWPRFARLGSDLRDGDIENIDELISELKGETINHIYIVGHADGMKISEKNKSLFVSNQALSEARASATALYIKDKLGLSDGQISSTGRGALEPVTNNQSEAGRGLNRRVELIVEIVDETDINRLNIILGDEGFASSKLVTTTEQQSGTILGVENIRLLTETGRTVDTDEYGLYHFEALKPGTHVVQIDPDSIPENMEPVLCHATTRHAGSSTSQFVEISDGLIWRANFHLQKKQLPDEVVKISLHSKVQDALVNFSLSASLSEGIGSKSDIQLTVSDDLRPALSSINVNGKAVTTVNNSQGILIPLPGDTQQHSITFHANSRALAAGEYNLSAQLLSAGQGSPQLQTNSASNSFSISSSKQRSERYEFNTHFVAGQTDLSKADQITLEDIIFLLRDKQVNKIKVVGHTDASPMSDRVKALYGDNYQLSRERAKNIVEYIQRQLQLKNIATEIEGKGASEPVSSNRNEADRAKNRRAELYIYTTSTLKNSELVINQAKSDVSVVVPRFIDSDKAATPNTTEAPQPSVDGILSIKEGAHIASTNMPIRVQLDSRLKLVLSLDGEVIPMDKVGFRMQDDEHNKTIYTFFGIDTGNKGSHRIQLKGMGPFGNARFEQSINYIRTGSIHSIKQSKEKLGNSADGNSPLQARIMLLDDSGEVIEAEAKLKIVSGNLQAYVANKNALNTEDDASSSITVDRNGILRFAPVNKAGLYKATLEYNDAEVDVNVYVSPKYRDWVMVGLAEGTLGNNDVSGNTQNLSAADIEDDFYNEGRLAFYAKGKILGKYLLTTAFDSSKKRQRDERLQQVINPDDYYTLYGDNTEQQFDAASREKLYIRLDADRFYAMFGDMNTELNATQLSRYSRALTGFRAAYESEHASVNVFAAETSQAYKRDEILGQGISGLYYLRAKNIVGNSETIRIETRDRLRPEVIVETRTLSRFNDYNIDYQDGSLYFKQAIPRNGVDFNPVYIVAEYESYNTNSEDIVAGGRAAIKLNDDKIELGISAIDDGTEGAEANLQGLDARIQLSNTLEFKAEVAQSEKQDSNNLSQTGDAYLAELQHDGKRLDAKLYLREQQGQFGVGQQNQSNSAMRSQGLDTDYRISETIKLRNNLRLEKNLNTQAERETITSDVIYQAGGLELNAGASISEDTDSSGAERTAEKLQLGASQQLLNDKLRLRAQTEYQINKTNENADHPVRHLVGADYKVSAFADVYAEHEFANNQALNSSTSRIGLRARPWESGVINTSVENRHSENEERANAVFGLSQSIAINEKWRASFAYDQSSTIHKQTINAFNADAPLASGSSFTAIPSTSNNLDNDFWAVSTGLSYRTTQYLFDNRLEYRDSDANDKYTVLSTWKRELNNGVAHALRLQLFHTDAHKGNDDESSAELRYSSVYRPLDSRWIALNRTEYKHDENTLRSAGSINKRLVENLAINYLADQWQAAGHFGLKHQIIETGINEFSNNSFVLGSELRYDLSQHWDIGAQYHRLFSPKLGLAQDSYGLSVGVDVAKNLWLSVGYNAKGYYDEDFSVNGFTAQGAFIKLRFKFDQNTFKLNGD